MAHAMPDLFKQAARLQPMHALLVGEEKVIMGHSEAIRRMMQEFNMEKKGL